MKRRSSNPQAGGSSPRRTMTGSSSTTIRLGICAMDKKARSKPMREILKRLDPESFEPIFFGDDVILNDPVESWPVCDVLIAFYSDGYPLEKAEEYATLQRPYLLNDLGMQRTLMDRRRVYELLVESGIDVPHHVFASRDGYVSTSIQKERGGDGGVPPPSPSRRHSVRDEELEIDEHDDHIEVGGVVIHKPFVEKPVNADDHNIAIYYPSSAGGGCKKLFRKVGDRSSEFYPEINEIRRDGSYIYESFVETQGTDVKMYTVGPDYGHAEARKSPAIDGKVKRNADGKEVRFPVILTLREKEIARRITLVFKQFVCGFDILRIQKGDSLVSFVIDVNGWSFVKNSRQVTETTDGLRSIFVNHYSYLLESHQYHCRKYYDDCAQILTEHLLAALKPKSRISFSALAPLLTTIEDPVDGITKMKNMLHQRVPTLSRLTSIFTKENSGAEEKQAGRDKGRDDAMNDSVFCSPVSDIPHELASDPASFPSVSAAHTHQEELRCIITIIRHGDRTPKQKLKDNVKGEHYLKYFHDHSTKVKKNLKVNSKKEMVSFLATINSVISDAGPDDMNNAKRIRDILQRWKISGLNRKIQMKPRDWTSDGTKTKCSELQLIVKWGGDLTVLGEKQAVRLGNRLRDELYPSNNDGGILRLHSTFRHDMKIRTSDEGRVMKTAAAFAKGLLELEGDLPPILVSLVHKEKDSQHMLDHTGHTEVEKDLKMCKERINTMMQKDINFEEMTKEMRESLVGPERLVSLHRALKKIGNPRKNLFAIHSTIGHLLRKLEVMLGGLSAEVEDVIEGGAGLRSSFRHEEVLSGIKLYKGETLRELFDRWKFVADKLYDEENNQFDLSTIPDVHDNVRFDMLHNPHLGLTETLSKLYELAKDFADCVVPQEYGVTIEEKRGIGSRMCHTLMEKINYDLVIARIDNEVDMRYLINMDYSSDLPIQSLGRRVRSRLYFTSESHLHSLLNVLRFPAIVPSPLSVKGQGIIANASELCYLTQIVIRLFEDNHKPSDDPKRFRVEILFSPGATATPLHMAELHHERDDSRYDTEKLQKISIDGLTCAQVEEYLAEAIKEGETDNDDDNDDPSNTPCWKTLPTNALSYKNKFNKEDTTPSETLTETNSLDKHDRSANNVEHFWRSAAIFGVSLGAGCLFMTFRAFKRTR